jgi:zinc protease
MKRFILSILTLSVLQIHASAQSIDRTKAPAAGPAPVINIPDASSFTLPNGLKVFVVTNNKLPQVSATLTIDRIAVQEGNKAGMAEMSGVLMRYGTTKMNKEKLDEAIDFLGGSVNTSALSASASSLTKNFPSIMALMSDVVLRPSFPAKELESIRKQTLSGLEAQKSSPDAIMNNVSSVLLYGKDHPYGEITTEETVKSVTVADIKKFYSRLWKPNIAYLVFVGDITTAKAKQLATQYFGSWQKGVVPAEKYPAIKMPAKTYVAIVDRPSSVQSVINIVTPAALQPGTPNAIPASILNTMLGGGFSSRLMQNLREKYGFTYGARSSFNTDRLMGSFKANASVRNEKTDSAIAQFLYEIQRISSESPTDKELSSMKNYMSGGFARSLEEPATIANFALNTAIYKLPKDYYRNYLTTLNGVSPATINQVAKTYINGPMIIAIVGNAKEIAPGLEKYGEVKYFDMYGNPVAAPVTKTIDVSIKPEDILKKALKAYGSEAAIAGLKDAEMKGTIEIMGQQLEYTQKNVLPGSFTTSVSMAGMTVMKQTKKGDAYSMAMQGNDIPVDDNSKEEMNGRAAFFEEAYLLKATGYTYKLKGIEQVEGKDAYVMDIIAPGGGITTAYYDVASGLKVQQLSEKEAGPMGKMTITSIFKNYKAFDGIMVPTELVNDFGQFKQSITITSVKFNQGLKEADL